MDNKEVSFKNYYPKPLLIFGILYSLVNLYAAFVVPSACDLVPHVRTQAVNERPSHILVVLTLGNIMLTPLSVIRKAPGWRYHLYERLMYYAYGFIGISMIYDHADLGIYVRDCVFEGSGYPYPLLYINYTISMICGVIISCEFLVRTYWNFEYIGQQLCSKKHRRKHLKIQQAQTEGKFDIFDVLMEAEKNCTLNRQKLDTLKEFKECSQIKHMFAYSGYTEEQLNEKIHPFFEKAAKLLKPDYTKQGKKYKLKLQIPKNIHDPRAYTLLKYFAYNNPKLLQNGPANAIVSYYNGQASPDLIMNRTQNMLIFGGFIVISITVLTNHGFDALFILFNVYSLTRAMVFAWKNWLLYYSLFENVVETLYNILAIAWAISSFAIRDSIEINSYWIKSPMIAFITIRVTQALELIPAVRQFNVFLLVAFKQASGLFIVLILTLFGFSGAYQTILSQIVNSDTSERYTYINTFSLVAEQAIGGFTRLPTNINGSAIQYLACLFITIILLNSLIAILSDAWVEVKENYVAYSNYYFLPGTLGYIDSKSNKRKGIEQEDVFIEWFEPNKVDDPDWNEEEDHSFKKVQQTMNNIEKVTKEPEMTGYKNIKFATQKEEQMAINKNIGSSDQKQSQETGNRLVGEFLDS